MLSPASLLALAGLFFLTGLLYPSVGQGGASGYPAVVSLVGLAPAAMSTAALLLNVLVVGTAFVTSHRADYFSWRLTWPFAQASMPAAFVGGRIHVATGVHLLLLGGGILLSPLMILLRRADAQRTAATSAAFTVINSIAGPARTHDRGPIRRRRPAGWSALARAHAVSVRRACAAFWAWCCSSPRSSRFKPHAYEVRNEQAHRLHRPSRGGRPRPAHRCRSAGRLVVV